MMSLDTRSMPPKAKLDQLLSGLRLRLIGLKHRFTTLFTNHQFQELMGKAGSARIIIGSVLLAAVVMGVGAAVRLSSQKQDIRQQAATNCCSDPGWANGRFGSDGCHTPEQWTAGYNACQNHDCAACAEDKKDQAGKAVTCPATDKCESAGYGEQCHYGFVNNGGSCNAEVYFCNSSGQWENRGRQPVSCGSDNNAVDNAKPTPTPKPKQPVATPTEDATDPESLASDVSNHNNSFLDESLFDRYCLSRSDAKMTCTYGYKYVSSCPTGTKYVCKSDIKKLTPTPKPSNTPQPTVGSLANTPVPTAKPNPYCGVCRKPGASYGDDYEDGICVADLSQNGKSCGANRICSYGSCINKSTPTNTPTPTPDLSKYEGLDYCQQYGDGVSCTVSKNGYRVVGYCYSGRCVGVSVSHTPTPQPTNTPRPTRRPTTPYWELAATTRPTRTPTPTLRSTSTITTINRGNGYCIKSPKRCKEGFTLQSDEKCSSGFKCVPKGRELQQQCGVCENIAYNINRERVCSPKPRGYQCGTDMACDGNGRCVNSKDLYTPNCISESKKNKAIKNYSSAEGSLSCKKDKRCPAREPYVCNYRRSKSQPTTPVPTTLLTKGSSSCSLSYREAIQRCAKNYKQCDNGKYQCLLEGKKNDVGLDCPYKDEAGAYTGCVSKGGYTDIGCKSGFRCKSGRAKQEHEYERSIASNNPTSTEPVFSSTAIPTGEWRGCPYSDWLKASTECSQKGYGFTSLGCPEGQFKCVNDNASTPDLYKYNPNVCQLPGHKTGFCSLARGVTGKCVDGECKPISKIDRVLHPVRGDSVVDSINCGPCRKAVRSLKGKIACVPDSLQNYQPCGKEVDKDDGTVTYKMCFNGQCKLPNEVKPPKPEGLVAKVNYLRESNSVSDLAKRLFDLTPISSASDTYFTEVPEINNAINNFKQNFKQAPLPTKIVMTGTAIISAPAMLMASPTMLFAYNGMRIGLGDERSAKIAQGTVVSSIPLAETLDEHITGGRYTKQYVKSLPSIYKDYAGAAEFGISFLAGEWVINPIAGEVINYTKPVWSPVVGAGKTVVKTAFKPVGYVAKKGITEPVGSLASKLLGRGGAEELASIGGKQAVKDVALALDDGIEVLGRQLVMNSEDDITKEALQVLEEKGAKVLLKQDDEVVKYLVNEGGDKGITLVTEHNTSFAVGKSKVSNLSAKEVEKLVKESLETSTQKAKSLLANVEDKVISKWSPPTKVGEVKYLEVEGKYFEVVSENSDDGLKWVLKTDKGVPEPPPPPIGDKPAEIVKVDRSLLEGVDSLGEQVVKDVTEGVADDVLKTASKQIGELDNVGGRVITKVDKNGNPIQWFENRGGKEGIVWVQVGKDGAKQEIEGFTKRGVKNILKMLTKEADEGIAGRVVETGSKQAVEQATDDVLNAAGKQVDELSKVGSTATTMFDDFLENQIRSVKPDYDPSKTIRVFRGTGEWGGQLAGGLRNGKSLEELLSTPLSTRLREAGLNSMRIEELEKVSLLPAKSLEAYNLTQSGMDVSPYLSTSKDFEAAKGFAEWAAKKEGRAFVIEAEVPKDLTIDVDRWASLAEIATGKVKFGIKSFLKGNSVSAEAEVGVLGGIKEEWIKRVHIFDSSGYLGYVKFPQ